MMWNDSCRVFAELKPPTWQGRKWNTLTAGWCVCAVQYLLFFPPTHDNVMLSHRKSGLHFQSPLPETQTRVTDLVKTSKLSALLLLHWSLFDKRADATVCDTEMFLFCVSFTNEYYKDLTVKRLFHQTSFSVSLCRGLFVKSARYGVAFHFTNCEDMYPLDNKLKTAHFCRNALNETVINRTTHFKEKEQKLWFSRGFALFI